MNMNFWLEVSVSLVIVSVILYLCYNVIPNNEKVKNFIIKNKKFLSPNCISNWRKFLGGPVIALFFVGMIEKEIYLVYFSIWTYVLLAITDVLDGIIARSCGMATTQGAILDAEADKWFDLPALTFFCFFPSFSPIYSIIVIPIIVFDIIGQKTRGKNSPPEAGIVGKTKTTVKFIVIYLMSFAGRYPEIYSTLKLQTVILILLISASILAGMSMGMKTAWYRNYVRTYLDDFLGYLFLTKKPKAPLQGAFAFL